MTIQMRKGWVLLRNGRVDYAEPNKVGNCTETHPWRLRCCAGSVREDGYYFNPGSVTKHPIDVIELLDPWDDRVPEECREKRFVVGTRVDTFPSPQESVPCVYDRATRLCATYATHADAVELAGECSKVYSESGKVISCGWERRCMITLDGKPCNPDGSPIADESKPVNGPVPAVEAEPEKRYVVRVVTSRYGFSVWCVLDRLLDRVAFSSNREDAERIARDANAGNDHCGSQWESTIGFVLTDEMPATAVERSSRERPNT